MKESDYEKIRNLLQTPFFTIERLREGDVVAPKIIDVSYDNIEKVVEMLYTMERKQIKRDEVLNN